MGSACGALAARRSPGPCPKAWSWMSISCRAGANHGSQGRRMAPFPASRPATGHHPPPLPTSACGLPIARGSKQLTVPLVNNGNR